MYGSILLVQNEKVKRLDIRSRVVKMIEYKKVEREHNDNRIDYRVGSHEIWLDARNANIDNLLPRQTNSLYKLTELFTLLFATIRCTLIIPMITGKSLHLTLALNKSSPKWIILIILI